MPSVRHKQERDVVVITGASGFLGRRVVDLLRRSTPRARLIAIVRDRRSAPAFGTGVEVVGGDLRLAEVWRRLPITVTHVIHLAARIPRSPTRSGRASVVIDNVAPLAQLLAVSSAWPGLRQVVYGSSVSVYGRSARRFRESSPRRPSTMYGGAKLCGEQLLGVLSQRGIAVASLRFSSLYGTDQYQGTVLPLLVDRARRGLRLELFNARRVQDFLHVDDAARATYLTYQKGAQGAFNIGFGRSVSMSALADAVLRCFDARGVSRIVHLGTGVAEDFGIRLDVSRARRILAFRPRIDLDDGLRRLARTPAVPARAALL